MSQSGLMLMRQSSSSPHSPRYHHKVKSTAQNYQQRRHHSLLSTASVLAVRVSPTWADDGSRGAPRSLSQRRRIKRPSYVVSGWTLTLANRIRSQGEIRARLHNNNHSNSATMTSPMTLSDIEVLKLNEVSTMGRNVPLENYSHYHSIAFDEYNELYVGGPRVASSRRITRWSSANWEQARHAQLDY